MRFFKLNAALLALIFTIVAGLLLFGVVRIFGNFTQFGTPLNFISWFGFWFVITPCFYLPRNLGDALCIPFCLLQLWLVFLAGIAFTRYVSRKNDPQTRKRIITILTITLVASSVCLIYSELWQNSNWKGMLGSLASNQGYEEADKDFNSGKLRVFTISGECHEDKFSGTNDGPFQIWIAEYFPASTYPERYSDEVKIKYYNLHMRSKYNWSLTHTNNIKSFR